MKDERERYKFAVKKRRAAQNGSTSSTESSSAGILITQQY
jgi:hypothetical protein